MIETTWQNRVGIERLELEINGLIYKKLKQKTVG